MLLISIKIKYKITQFQNFIININCCEMIIRLFTLLVLYLIFWFLLSGHFDPLFIFLGIASTLLCVYVSWKANFLDNEGVPLHLFLKLPHYILWLTLEILKANLDTAKIILTQITEMEFYFDEHSMQQTYQQGHLPKYEF